MKPALRLDGPWNRSNTSSAALSCALVLPGHRAGDGVLLHGRTFYVVRNRLNAIVVIELNLQLTTGVVVDVITHAGFRVQRPSPATVARSMQRTRALTWSRRRRQTTM